MKLMNDDDMVLAVGCPACLMLLLMAPLGIVPVLLENKIPRAMWQLERRITVPGQSALWWKERAGVVRLDMLYFAPPSAVVLHLANNITAIPEATSPV